MGVSETSIDSDLLQQVRAWRHDIHRCPEMAFAEHETAAIVARALNGFGYAVTTGIAKTGVVASRTFGPGPRIALRADMDALPITEKNALPYASRRSGCMHACGHDGHTAMLLGAAKLLARRRDLRGTVHLLFQPAEENEGGAQAMLDEGLLERFQIDEIYGLHNMPGVALGEFQVREGPILASFERFSISLRGAGGHGAMPQQARNPIGAAAALVSELQSLVPRLVAPAEPAVITVGHIETAGSYNVIPEHATLLGSLRSLSAPTRALLQEHIQRACDGVGSAHRIEVSCRFEQGYPATVNSAANARFVQDTLRDLVGEDRVHTDFEPYLGSEDFAFYLQKIPGCYFIMGNGPGSPLHSPTYNFNDDAARYGIAAWVALAEKAMTGCAQSLAESSKYR